MAKKKRQSNRRQQRQARKKQKRAKLARARRAQSDFTQAGTWPIAGAWISDSWQTRDRLVQAALARQRPDGQIALAIFLLDPGCLGVKDAGLHAGLTGPQFEHFVDTMFQAQPGGPCAPELLAKVVEAVRAYAESLGFPPHSDFLRARRLLEGIDPAASDAEIELGRDGVPFYAAGPYDDAEAILAQLTERLGADGFHYMAPPEFALGGWDELED